MLWCLSKTTIKWSKSEDYEILRNFLETFKISSDFEELNFYDFGKILLLMILYCKDDIITKFELIFDLFDEDKDGVLSKNQVKDVYECILQTIFQFSTEMLIYKKHLQKESQFYAILFKKTDDSVNYNISNLIKFFYFLDQRYFG